MSRTRRLLELDPAVVRRARSLARKAAAPGRRDRAAATRPSPSSGPRCAWPGSSGADHERVPWVNHLVDAVRDEVGLEHGVTTPVYDALLRGEAPDLHDARPEGRERQRARSGCPPGREATAARGARPRRASAPACGPSTARGPTRDRLVKRHGDPRTQAVDLPHRRHRRHLRGHPAGPGRRARGRRRHRRHPLDRAVAARLRARGRHPRGLRRHLRHAGELPPHAGRARRREQGARPLRPADQLRLGPVHARDRGAGRARAARHDAQRLDVRDPLPRHQPDPHLRRPALLAARSTPAPGSSSTPARTTTSPPPTPSRPRTPSRSASCSTSASPRRPGSRTGSSASATPSRSTPRSPTASGWSWPTRCSPASSSRTRR